MEDDIIDDATKISVWSKKKSDLTVIDDLKVGLTLTVITTVVGALTLAAVKAGTHSLGMLRKRKIKDAEEKKIVAEVIKEDKDQG